MRRPHCLSPCLLAAALLACGANAAADGGVVGYGGFVGDREQQRGWQPPPRDSWNSWYGPSRPYRNEHVGEWAIGTFHGRNGANGQEETITIQPDGNVEVRTPGAAPTYGTFAGTTLTLGTLVRKVEPTRGGLVIDGAYYRR
ncbi:MAG: hypothetical protein ACM3JC_09375 [Rudaea sp.]